MSKQGYKLFQKWDKSRLPLYSVFFSFREQPWLAPVPSSFGFLVTQERVRWVRNGFDDVYSGNRDSAKIVKTPQNEPNLEMVPILDVTKDNIYPFFFLFSASF